MEKELETLEIMKRVEIVYALDSRDELPGEIILTEAVESLLSEPSTFHLFYKYLNHFRDKYRMKIAEDIAASYCQYMLKYQGTNALPFIRIGFGLAELLLGYGAYEDVESVLLSLMNYLAKNPVLENWIAMYEALVKIMEINNININFKRSDWARGMFAEMARKIKLMSFGQDILDESG